MLDDLLELEWHGNHLRQELTGLDKKVADAEAGITRAKQDVDECRHHFSLVNEVQREGEGEAESEGQASA